MAEHATHIIERKGLRSAIVTVLGYTQPATYRVGLGILHKRLEDRYFDQRVDKTWLHAWKADHKSTVKRLKDLGVAQIYAIGYSYGCGHGIKTLGKLLKSEGMSIDVAYMVDPVPRFKFLPVKALSMTRIGSFACPANCKLVFYWRQVNGAPYGRPVVHPDAQYKVKPVAVFGSAKNLKKHAVPLEPESIRQLDSASTHTTIDNRTEIHNHILADLAARIGPPHENADD